MQRSLLIALVVLAGLAGAAAGWWSAQRPPPALAAGTWLPQPRPLPEFSLLDQSGATAGRAALAGRWHWVFFGFTSCPDVCPATLAALASARRQLDDLAPADRPGVVLVSVDPVRDTPERLAPYLRHFDPEFRGLTGEPAAIGAFARELGIAVHYGEPDEHGNYTVDHTAAVLLLDRDGALAAVFGAPHAPAALAGDFRRILDHRE